MHALIHCVIVNYYIDITFKIVPGTSFVEELSAMCVSQVFLNCAENVTDPKADLRMISGCFTLELSVKHLHEVRFSSVRLTDFWLNTALDTGPMQT